jgi:UDP-N-acetylmuramate: L-alanyl-gamma-D-glutamyl-meso-diaminopimelate ligase
VAGVTVFDDFAHHPTAVRATLEALRGSREAPATDPGAPAGRLVAVFEPRSYTSRTRVFQEAFAQAFGAADAVLVSAAHLPGKVPERERLSEAELVAGIRARGTRADFVPEVDAIVARLVGELRAGDRVVILSNGGFGGLHEKLLAGLRLARESGL